MGHGEAKDGVGKLYVRWFIEHFLGIRPKDREVQKGGFMSILFTALSPEPRTSANKQ